MFAPESVAVIGATETPGSVGRALMENLKSYCGLVYPVNRKRDTILRVRSRGSEAPGNNRRSSRTNANSWAELSWSNDTEARSERDFCFALGKGW